MKFSSSHHTTTNYLQKTKNTIMQKIKKQQSIMRMHFLIFLTLQFYFLNSCHTILHTNFNWLKNLLIFEKNHFWKTTTQKFKLSVCHYFFNKWYENEEVYNFIKHLFSFSSSSSSWSICSLPSLISENDERNWPGGRRRSTKEVRFFPFIFKTHLLTLLLFYSHNASYLEAQKVRLQLVLFILNLT